MIETQFLTDQLIPYIGSKRKLVGLVRRAIERTGVRHGTVLDLFAGAGVVSRLAKTMGFRVFSNDWEPYTVPIARTYVASNRPPEFRRLGGLDTALETLNNLPAAAGYISRHYCPADDETPDPSCERMFYTRQNGERIDAIRQELEDWRAARVVSESEFHVLLAPLVFQAAYVSNTSGVFKGWHNGWGGRTGTALYRIRSRLTLRPPVFLDNGLRNEVFCADANQLAGEIDCDVAYLDPPYNQHQYGSNYHLLNTVALWDKPAVAARFGRSGRRDKAAIRSDWRRLRRSAYCYRRSAPQAFVELLAKLRTRWILVSYSTDGIIDPDWMVEAAAERGRVDVVTQRYKRYRVSSQRPSPRSHTTEFVLIVDCGRSSRRGDVDRVRRRIGPQAAGSDEDEGREAAG